ncbi:membrane protein insertase YidC [Nonomuraea sp. SMC257]|uniref:Membrane protein insertase YidC n=1 Tax=Nonomuraea montanisoli TaxID=2741721 RepID=A0A7Y6M6N8_9ACTN|nr:membrane protein insertase YidC [Nonomuraea montanisoli]NUW37098.1 membrane protein insertase YidC [Nonomuraea montanisoli]
MSGGHAALAIVLFTVAVRLLLLPLSVRQARAARITERLAPKVRALRERFGRNPERLAREMSALYAKEGSSPMAALLPGLAQAPFMWLVYRVATHPTALAGHDLLGAPLGQQIAGIVDNYGLISWPVSVFVVVIVLVMLVAWLQARRIAATLPAEQPPLLRRIMPLMPFGSVLAALVLPLAAGLYLLVSTAWTYGERTVLTRRLA